MMEQVHQEDKERRMEEAQLKVKERRMEEAQLRRIDRMMEELQQQRIERKMEDLQQKRIESMTIELRCQVLVEKQFMERRFKIELLKPGKQVEHEQKGENEPLEPNASPLIIVLGGRSQDGRSLASVEGYILLEERWIGLPEMNIPRAFHSSVVVGHEIIVSGGDVGDRITDTIEIKLLFNGEYLMQPCLSLYQVIRRLFMKEG